MNHLSVLRRILLLLCLLGAQHGALAHAYEHMSARSGQTVAAAEHGGGLHAVACVDCLSAYSLGTTLPLALPALCPGALTHVFVASAAVRASVCHLPEQRAHGPPASPVI